MYPSTRIHLCCQGSDEQERYFTLQLPAHYARTKFKRCLHSTHAVTERIWLEKDLSFDLQWLIVWVELYAQSNAASAGQSQAFAWRQSANYLTALRQLFKTIKSSGALQPRISFCLSPQTNRLLATR